MRVLEVISDMNIGGAGVLLLTRLRHSDKRKFETTVLLPSGSALIPRIRALGIPVRLMNGCCDRSIDPARIFELVRIIRQIDPTLINCHGCLSARIAAAVARVPLRLYTRHCVYPVPRYQRSLLWRKCFGGVTDILSHHVVAVADAARENLMEMGVSRERISVVINGAEPLRAVTEEERAGLRTAIGIRDDCFVVGISARLEDCKDHACFLRAAARLLRANPKGYSFLILGDGSRRAYLEALARNLGIAEDTHFVGFAEDVSPYVSLMDLNVNCSVGTETSSLAISEAMSLGIPTVASNYGGNPYMIRNGENGFLYPMGDDAALAERIRSIADSPALYAHLCRGARLRFLEELNASSMTKKAEQLYTRLFHEHIGVPFTDREDSSQY